MAKEFTQKLMDLEHQIEMYHVNNTLRRLNDLSAQSQEQLELILQVEAIIE